MHCGSYEDEYTFVIPFLSFVSNGMINGYCYTNLKEYFETVIFGVSINSNIHVTEVNFDPDKIKYFINSHNEGFFNKSI